MDPYQWPSGLPHYAQQTRTSTQCWFNTGPPSPALAINHSTLDSAFCWRWCVYRVGIQADIDPMSVNCNGPPSVTLAYIRRGAKHDRVAQYWAKCWLSVVDGGPILAQHWVNVSRLITFTIESAGQKNRNKMNGTYRRRACTDTNKRIS